MLGLAELQGPYTVSSHPLCYATEAWRGREWWDRGEQLSSLLLQHRELRLQAGSSHRKGCLPGLLAQIKAHW